MRLRTSFIALGLLAGLGLQTACADTDKPLADRGLIIEGTPIPAEASDSREDGVLRGPSGRPVTHELIGKTLPSFSTTNYLGEPFSTESLVGKWTVMTVWGVWCHDSRNDAENINAVGAYYADRDDINFVSLHVPPPKPKDLDKRYRKYGSVEAFFEDKGVAWPTVLDDTLDIRQALQIEWTPTYLLVGPDLTVRGYRTDLSVVEGETVLDDFFGNVDTIIAAADPS